MEEIRWKLTDDELGAFETVVQLGARCKDRSDELLAQAKAEQGIAKAAADRFVRCLSRAREIPWDRVGGYLTQVDPADGSLTVQLKPLPPASSGPPATTNPGENP